MSTSCLVTSTPEFDDPERTRPLLLAETAAPDLRQVVVVVDDGTPSFSIPFEAQVAPSVDNGQPVEVQLLIDYGVVIGGKIAADVEAGVDLPPDQDVLRTARVPWFPFGAGAIAPGCHTATLMVAHEFVNPSGCPAELADSSQLTWQFILCDPTLEEPCAFSCPDENAPPVEELVACPEVADGSFVPEVLQ